MAPDFRTVYTNFVNAGFSPFDVTLMLGEVMGPGADGKQIVLQRIKVLMAAPEAKVVSMILADAVARYEKQFGIIVIAKEQEPRLLEGD